ncbi:MAG TPA: 50S ribosomal protein L10 [Solirubrobacteraceae bacterium]|nr:50S ribosomal protein L10 [Solirubrobacteraceae bacterium]
MNREQKAATIEALATEIDSSEAVFAVDYRGISVSQVAELRSKLRDADATFRVVKNSLTERAADQVGAESLKTLLSGPTALTFVRGDAAMAAKAIADQARATQLLPFKGGLMDGDVLDADQIRAISRLPSREVLYGQLVGIVASPVSGLVRTLSALVSGLAVALGQVREKKESGEIPAGEPSAAAAPAVEEPAAPAEEPAQAEESAAPAAESAQAEESAAEPAEAEEPAAESAEAEASVEVAEPAEAEQASAGAPETQEEAPTEEASAADQAEPAVEPAEDDNQADASAQEQTESAEATKED